MSGRSRVAMFMAVAVAAHAATFLWFATPPAHAITAQTVTATPTPVPNVRQLSSNASCSWCYPIPRITNDGSLVVYDEDGQVQLVTTDGSIRRAGPSSCRQPYPSANGDQVVMVCRANVNGQNPDGNDEIVLLDRLTLSPITVSASSYFNDAPSISADGKTIAFVSDANYTGGNADGSAEIFSWRGGQLRQITRTADYSFYPYYPLISGDGHRVLFDRSGDLYVYDDQTGESEIARSVDTYSAQLTRDGQTALFGARVLVLGPNGGSRKQLYAQRIGGALQQLTKIVDRSSISAFAANGDASRVAVVFSDRQIDEGMLLTPAGPRILPGVPPDAPQLSFDAAGRKLAFVSWENLTGQNPSGLPQVFVADIPLDPPTPTPVPTHPVPPAGACAGDCTGDGHVTVDDILVLVKMASGSATGKSCPAFDANGDNQLTTDDILAAVTHALNGCPPLTELEQALQALAAGDLHCATQKVCAAAARASASDPANLSCAAARVFTKLLDDSNLQSLALAAGVSIVGDSHDVCSLHAIFPHLPPSGSPRTGQILAGFRDSLLPEIDAAVAQLEGLPGTVDVPFNLGNLPYCVRRNIGARAVEIDRGDVRALTAALKLVHAAIDALGAYDLDFNPHDLIDGTTQDLLAGDPALGRLTSAAQLARARQFGDAGLADSVDAITSILGETDDQSNDFLVIAPQDRGDAERTGQVLGLVRQALYHQVVLPTAIGLSQAARLDLGKLFAGQVTSLRPLLPAFDAEGDFDLAHFPDPTFGGIAPDLTQTVITRFLLGDNCSDYVEVETSAECEAAAAPRDCRGAYFYSYGSYSYCELYGCLCD